MTKYLVDIVSPTGKGRSIIIESMDTSDAVLQASRRYPTHEICRVVPYKGMSDYLSFISRMRKTNE